MAGNSNSSSNSNSTTGTPNLDKEFADNDEKANDNQSGNPRRDKFKQLHGDDSPSDNPTGGPPRDDTPPPPDSNEPLLEPTDNSSPSRPKP